MEKQMAEAKEMLTAAKIAEQLGVPPTKVKKVITDLGIEPDMKKGACNYYSTETIKKIKTSLN